MSDPLDGLRLPDGPVSPRPAFAADLRERLVAALDLQPRSPAMTNVIPDVATTQSVVPYLCVHDAEAALAFYAGAFAAVETLRVVGPDGRMGHCEFTVGTARFMMSDEYPEIGVVSPRSLGGSGFAVYLELADVDATTERAERAGAEVLSRPEDQVHGNRTATVRDPFGHRWMLAQPIERLDVATYARREQEFTVTAGERPPVELGYLVLHTADVARADRFYGQLFGWRLEAGHAGPGHGHVENTRLPMGFAPSVGDPPTLYFRIEDMDAATARVEELGGQVLSTDDVASGRNARCVDDQGTEFELWQPAPGY